MPKLDFSNHPQLPENFKFNPQMGQYETWVRSWRTPYGKGC
jgi:hypothetical protein